MRRRSFVVLVMVIVVLFSSCNTNIKQGGNKQQEARNRILQDKDGTISLKVEKADCYSDRINPESNTAEWSVLVSKSGRFNVWLSSAVKDTNNLHYSNSVMLSVHDSRLESRPACDKVILDSGEVSYPYFRADSFMGSLYIQDTGLYNIQVISDKILPEANNDNTSSDLDNTKIISVVLTPTTR